MSKLRISLVRLRLCAEDSVGLVIAWLRVSCYLFKIS